MKHLFRAPADESTGDAPATQKKEVDVAALVEKSFSSLRDEMSKLKDTVSKSYQPAPAKKQEPVEDDLDTVILTDPRKAVERIKAQVREEVMGAVSAESNVKAEFQNKFVELQSDYPEIGDINSDLHKKAKDIMAANGNRMDAASLELAVLKAAKDVGVSPMKYRRQSRNDDNEGDDYLGGASSGENRSKRKSAGSDKLPGNTLAFAQLVGMDVKDPKVIERLTKTYNGRKSNWNKYR